MTKPKKANFANFDSREFLSIAEGVALWAGREPLDNHKLYSDLTALKRKIQEVFFVLGFRSGKNPNSFPRFFEAVPRYGWVQVAEYMGERPLFLYPEERNPEKEKRLGSDKDVRIYKAVIDIQRLRKKSLNDAFAQVALFTGLPDSADPMKKRSTPAIRSAYHRGLAEIERRNGTKSTDS
jgi:hypothetical protein